jgi:hypothetical protein
MFVLKIAGSFVMCVLLAACSSLPKKETVILPATVESLFATCSSGDGALNIQIYESGNLRGSGDLEWLAEFERGWRSELINPVGKSLLQLTYDQSAQSFVKIGALAGSIPPLTVTEEFLEVDGHFVGVMPSEIPCFMKFRLPRNWLPNIYSFEQTANTLQMTFADEHRTIKTEITGTQPELTSRICSTISWSAVLGLVKRSLVICNEMTGARSGSLKGLDEFSIKWVDIDS